MTTRNVLALLLLPLVAMISTPLSAQVPGEASFSWMGEQGAAKATQSVSPSDGAIDIVARLEAIEAENARLRLESQELRETTKQLRMLVASEGDASAKQSLQQPVEQAGFTSQLFGCSCDTPGCDGCSTNCADCGKAVCEGMPHLCGVCLEDLGWNKAGGWRIVPFGRLRGDFIYSSAAYTNDAVIVFLNPNNPGVNEDSQAVTAKQSQINFAITGPKCKGWQTGGLVLINFMGAQPLRNFSGANIVNAYGEIKNDRWRFAFGRMLDLFGPIAPRTVNQISQRGAGNIGIYRGVFNIDRYITLNDAHRWTITSRISQPDISDYAAVPAINGQNNGWPNIEARVGVELGPTQKFGRPIEIGISGVVGEIQAVLPALAGGLIRPAADDVAQTRGVCVDAQFRGERFGFRGEGWWGEAAGTYFVASLQTVNPETNQGIDSVGGWGELYWNLSPRMTTHVGYGIDDPKNSDLGFLDRVNGPGQISLNDVAWWNLLFNVTEYFELGFEISHRRTNFIDANSDNDATLYHFSSSLNF